MALIDTLINKYFVDADDISPPSEPLPLTTAGCRITPLIHGSEYFSNLAATLATIGTGATPADNAGHFIYLSGWWLDLVGTDVNPAPGSVGSVKTSPGVPFSLDGIGGTQNLVDLLEQKVTKGVDVRVMGWVSWAVMSSAAAQSNKGGASIRDVNICTLRSIHELRKRGVQCCLNILGHTAGAAHLKYVVAGTATSVSGYTGGIDMRYDRFETFWHDVQIKVEGGTAVQAMYNYFRELWNIIHSRSVKTFRDGENSNPSKLTTNSNIPIRSIPAASPGTHHVQILRTLPQFNYSAFNCLPEGKAIEFESETTEEGVFEVKTAWRKAILAAEKYIYMEDQSYWSIEIMQWINESLKNHPDLKVILVASGIDDPNDPALPPYQLIAFEKGLLTGLSPAQLDQIVCVKRNGVFVHAKTTLIDDHWTIIGSANCSRRSLYTDLEHAIAMLDANDVLVRDYRVKLWGKSFELPTADYVKLNNLDQALNIWKSTWGSSGSGITLPLTYTNVPLPTPSFSLDSDQQEKYDRYIDLDSREAWGGVFP